jgi:hypothetical protein
MTVLYHQVVPRRTPKIVIEPGPRAGWIRRDARTALPTNFLATYDDLALAARITMKVVVRSRPEIDELLFERRDLLRSAPITAAELRRIALGEILREVLEKAAVLIDDAGDGHFRVPGDAPNTMRGGRRVGPGRGRAMPDDHLRAVATVYRDALKAGRRDPVNAVAAEMHASRPTAGRWVGQAREKGFLGRALGKQPGEKPIKKQKAQAKRPRRSKP